LIQGEEDVPSIGGDFDVATVALRSAYASVLRAWWKLRDKLCDALLGLGCERLIDT
jgi:hypothetical protein